MSVLLIKCTPFTNAVQSLNPGDLQTLKDAHNPGLVPRQVAASLYPPLKLMLNKGTSTAEAPPAWVGKIKPPRQKKQDKNTSWITKKRKEIKLYFNGLLVDQSPQTLFNYKIHMEGIK